MTISEGRSLPERVGTQEAAMILGRPIRTVQQLAPKIPGAAMIGGRWTFNEAKLRKWVERLEQQACRATYIEEAQRGGRASVSAGKSSADRYEQLIGKRPANA